MRRLFLAAFVFVVPIVLADEILMMKDGREIRVRDNGTWEYLTTPSTPPSARNAFADAETREIVKNAADHMIRSLNSAKLSVEIAILEFETGADRSMKGLEKSYDKARADFVAGKTLFEQASVRLASNVKTSEALNEMFIYWKTSLDQAGLAANASLRFYSSRMVAREKGLREKRDRLDLSLSYLSTAVPTVGQLKGEPQPARAAVPDDDPIRENLGQARVICPDGVKEVPFSSISRKTLQCGEEVTIAAQNKHFTRVKTAKGEEGYISPKVLQTTPQ